MFKLLKSGEFAFGGLRVKAVSDTVDLSDIEKEELVSYGWAIDWEEQAQPKDAPKSIDDAMIALFVEEGDKAGLAEYAAEFGVQLKRNKTVENMAADLKAALES